MNNLTDFAADDGVYKPEGQPHQDPINLNNQPQPTTQPDPIHYQPTNKKINQQPDGNSQSGSAAALPQNSPGFSQPDEPAVGPWATRQPDVDQSIPIDQPGSGSQD